MEDKEKRRTPQERLAGQLHGDAWNVWLNKKCAHFLYTSPSSPLAYFMVSSSHVLRMEACKGSFSIDTVQTGELPFYPCLFAIRLYGTYGCDAT